MSGYQKVGWHWLGLVLLSIALGLCLERSSLILAAAQNPVAQNLVSDPLPNGGLFILGDPIKLYTASNPAWVRYRLTDAYGEADWTVNGIEYQGVGSIESASSGGKWLVLPTDFVTRYGLYRLDIETNIGESDLRIGLVDPNLPLGAHNTSPVGFIIAIDPYRDFAVQLALLGIKWVHFDIPVDSADAVLYANTPEVSNFVDQALAQDLTPIFKLIGDAPPNWDDSNSPFYRNLRSVAQNYKEKVRYWIVGNEIDGCGWWRLCDAAAFVTFLRNVAQVIRGVDPQAKVLAADLYQGESEVLHKMLAAEQDDLSFTLFDILTVHYLEEGNGEELSPDGCCGSANTYRRIMGEYGVYKPIWNTEALSPLVGGLHWGVGQSSYFRGGEAVPFLSPAKTIVGNQASGANKVFFFSYNYDQSLLEGEGELKRGLTERALAVRAFADQLQTASYLGRLNDVPAFLEGHWYQNGAERILVIWSNESNREAEAILQTNSETVWLFDPLGNGYPLQARDGKVKFRVHYEPQFVRGFTNYEGIAFEDNSQNDAPYFVSKPIQRAVVGRPYAYLAQAYDSDPTQQRNALIPLTYSLLEKPAGMNIEYRGLLTWTPSAAGTYRVSVQARDAQGNTAIQSFEIQVVAATQNVPPHILSSPRTIYGAVGTPYGYNLNAWDANGDAITYSFSRSPDWLQIDPQSGFIRGTPPYGGIFPVTVQVSDNRGGYTEQSFELHIFPTLSLDYSIYLPLCAKP